MIQDGCGLCLGHGVVHQRYVGEKLLRCFKRLQTIDFVRQVQRKIARRIADHVPLRRRRTASRGSKRGVIVVVVVIGSMEVVVEVVMGLMEVVVGSVVVVVR